ncbi:MAG: FAD-dependent oxidoreductase, partial [Verrucomicrobiota bacterium]
MKRRIAIVGAGVAGLSAARHLASAQADISLFDKGRAPGGRATTRRGLTFTFDHGAQYFTVRDARFKSLVNDLQRDGIVRPWTPRLKIFGDHTPRDEGPVKRWIGVPGMSALGQALAFGLEVRTECRVTEIKQA